MKQHQGRNTRQLILAVALAVTVIAGGLLLKGSAQRTLAVAPAAVETSYKTASSSTVSAGGELTYQIVLSNTSGVNVGPVVVTDALPDEVAYVPGSAVHPGTIDFGFNAGLRELTFTAATLGATPITVSFRVTADTALQPGDLITNTAVISEGGIPLDRSYTVTVEAPPTARIETPWDNQLITQRGSFTVTGRAWTDSQEPEFPAAPVLEPIVSSQSWYTVRWSSVSDAQVYILQEADNPNFADATEFAPTMNLSQLISGKTSGTFYYRVKASDDVYGDGFWSNVVSFTVSTATWAAAEDAVAPASVSYQPGVEINIKPVGGADNWVPVTTVTTGVGDWWNWSYNWTLPEADNVQYVIQVRGADLSGGSDLSAVDTVTVTIQNGTTTIYLPLIAKRYPPVPYPPALQVANNTGFGTYQLSWTYLHAEAVPTSYELQESKDATFSDNLTPTVVTSPASFTNKPAGHYYYRVRGINNNGEGEWSNVVDVQVTGYSDDFSNPASGWPRQVIHLNNRPVFDMNYENGSYRAKLLLNTSGLNNYLMGIVKAPYDNPFGHYEVKVEHRFAAAGDQLAPPEWGKGGLVFAATSDYKTIFVVEWRYPDGWCAISKYTGVDNVVVDIRRPGNGAIRAWGPCPVVGGYDKITRARAVVNGNSASVYLNDSLIGTFTDNTLSSAHRVGFLTGSYERTPVEGRYDNFQVAPR